MKKLNDYIGRQNITYYGFGALVALQGLSTCCKHSKQTIISSLSPAIMLSKEISHYYAPIILRGSAFIDRNDVIKADLDLQQVTVAETIDLDAADGVTIVSRHAGTIELLKQMYPNYKRVISGDASWEDINQKQIVGTLPPHLIQYALAYKAITIKDFDYATDGDLSGQELKDRLVIADKTITVSIDI